MTLKKHPIVMLPTKAEAPSYTEGMLVQCFRQWNPIGEAPIPVGRLSLSVNHSKGVLDYYVPHHLYILSDDDIEHGDWYLNLLTNTIHQCDNTYVWLPGFRKIIATTDKSIKFNIDTTEKGEHIYEYLPTIDESFVKYFIEHYNEGNIITDVIVEYEEDVHNPMYGSGLNEYMKLKVSSDNTITIKSVKDNYSRDEVIEILKKFDIEMGDTHGPTTRDKWIEQNL